MSAIMWTCYALLSSGLWTCSCISLPKPPFVSSLCWVDFYSHLRSQLTHHLPQEASPRHPHSTLCWLLYQHLYLVLKLRFSDLSLQLKSIFCSSYITSAEHSTWYVVGDEQIFTESVNLVTGMTADEVWKREFGIKLWRALDSMLRYLYFILQAMGSHWWFLRREWHNLNFLF